MKNKLQLWECILTWPVRCSHRSIGKCGESMWPTCKICMVTFFALKRITRSHWFLLKWLEFACKNLQNNGKCVCTFCLHWNTESSVMSQVPPAHNSLNSVEYGKYAVSFIYACRNVLVITGGSYPPDMPFWTFKFNVIQHF